MKTPKEKEGKLIFFVKCDKCNRKATHQPFLKDEYYCKRHMENPTDDNKLLYPLYVSKGSPLRW